MPTTSSPDMRSTSMAAVASATTKTSAPPAVILLGDPHGPMRRAHRGQIAVHDRRARQIVQDAEGGAQRDAGEPDRGGQDVRARVVQNRSELVAQRARAGERDRARDQHGGEREPEQSGEASEGSSSRRREIGEREPAASPQGVEQRSQRKQAEVRGEQQGRERAHQSACHGLVLEPESLCEVQPRRRAEENRIFAR